MPGVPKDQNSYRSELAGQLGIASFFESICLPANSYHSFTLCDGLAALNSVGSASETIKCRGKHVDLISMTTELWDRSMFNFTQRHVYGHRDDLNRPLTLDEQLNVRMDVLAKKIAMDHVHSQAPITAHDTSLGFGTIRCGGDLIS